MSLWFRGSCTRGVLLLLLPLLAGCPQMVSSLPAEATRVTIKSQCAQNVIACTSSWPVAMASVIALEGQTVSATADGFMVIGEIEHGEFDVLLSAGDSTVGNDATSLSYFWSTGATDTDPCSLIDGTVFSNEEMPIQRLDVGLHYIRLRVENDIIRDVVDTDSCGVFGENIPSFDFIEIVVDVRSG